MIYEYGLIPTGTTDPATGEPVEWQLTPDADVLDGDSVEDWIDAVCDAYPGEQVEVEPLPEIEGSIHRCGDARAYRVTISGQAPKLVAVLVAWEPAEEAEVAP